MDFDLSVQGNKPTLQSTTMALVFAVVFSISVLGVGAFEISVNSAFAQAPVPKENSHNLSFKKQHPWATFTPGAWKTVRIVSESFDKEGKSHETSLTDTKSTLESLTNKGIQLQIEVCLWLPGRRLDPKPQSVEQGYHGEVGNFEKEVIKELKPVELTIAGKVIPCKVCKITLTEPKTDRVRTIKLFYNEKVAPYLLRRESEIRDAKKKISLAKTTMAVNSLNMPWESCGKLFSVAVAQTATVTPKESMTSLTFLSTEVPGLVVYEATKEIDSEGKTIRRSVSRMTDFNTSLETEKRPGILKRRRATRSQRKSALPSKSEE